MIDVTFKAHEVPKNQSTYVPKDHPHPTAHMTFVSFSSRPAGSAEVVAAEAAGSAEMPAAGQTGSETGEPEVAEAETEAEVAATLAAAAFAATAASCALRSYNVYQT